MSYKKLHFLLLSGSGFIGKVTSVTTSGSNLLNHKELSTPSKAGRPFRETPNKFEDGAITNYMKLNKGK